MLLPNGPSSHGSPTRRTAETRAAFETLDLAAALGGTARSSTRGRIAIRAAATEHDRPLVTVAPKTVPAKRAWRPSPKWLGWAAAGAVAVVAIVLTDPAGHERVAGARDLAVAGVAPTDRDRATDLRAAIGADEPCLAFAAALARVDRAADPHDLVLLGDVDVPKARASDDATTAAICDALPKLVGAVRTRLARVGHARR
jgi:hypothetical protein